MRAVVLWCGAYAREKRDWDDVARSREDIQHASRAAAAWGARAILVLSPDDSMTPHPESPAWPTIRRRSADPDMLDAELAKLAGEGVTELLFVATNHGHPDGLALQPASVDVFDDPPERPWTLSPAALRASLERVPGRQAILIATCYAGVFLELGSERRGVVVCCGRDELYHVERQERPFSPLLRQVLDRWLGMSGAERLELRGSVAVAIQHPECCLLARPTGVIRHAPATAGAFPDW